MGWWRFLALGALITGGVARADEVEAPRNVNAEPSTPQSAELSSRSATAEMQGDPQDALRLADAAIRADPRDPWPYYDKGMALARLGQTDPAVATLNAAEQRFAPNDRWGRSVAVFGQARALALAGRCGEAAQAYARYAALVPEDATAPELARRYAADCRPRAGALPGPMR